MTKYVKSREALPSNLHLWESAPTQTVIAETKTVDFYPTSSIESSDTVSFVIPPMQKYMLDKVEVKRQWGLIKTRAPISMQNTCLFTLTQLFLERYGDDYYMDLALWFLIA